jgi:propanol-preferring alcohol dehydrogenase
MEYTKTIMSTEMCRKEHTEKNYPWRSKLRLNLVTMPIRAYRVIGLYTGTLNNLIEEVTSAARRRIIKPIVSNRFKLVEATEALHMLKDGKTVVRGVTNP